jgi:hypothetical protein
MEGSASAREQTHYSDRLMAAGERLRRRAELMGGIPRNTDRGSNGYAGIAVALTECTVVIIASISTSRKRSSGPPGARELKGDR